MKSKVYQSCVVFTTDLRDGSVTAYLDRFLRSDLKDSTPFQIFVRKFSSRPLLVVTQVELIDNFTFTGNISLN